MRTDTKIEELLRSASSLYQNHMELDEIKSALMRQGADEELAKHIVYLLDNKNEKEQRRLGKYLFCGGIILFILSLLFIILVFGDFDNIGPFEFILFLACLISMVLGSYGMRFGRSKSKRPADPFSAFQGKKKTEQVLVSILKELGCSYEETSEEEGKKVFTFNYQGTTFQVITISDSPFVEIIYSFFFETQMEHLPTVRILCNRLNNKLILSKCLYTVEEELNEVNVHCSTGYLLMDEMPRKKDLFSSLLDSNFSIRDSFSSEFEQIKREVEGEDLEATTAEQVRKVFLLREQEISHQPDDWQWHLHETRKLSLGELLTTLYDQDKTVLQKVVVVTDSLHEISSSDEALALDLSSLLISKSSQGDYVLSHKQATVIVYYGESHAITLDLRDEGETDYSFYFRITACKPALSIDRETTLNGDRNDADTCSLLIAFDKQSAEEKRAEFNYMWQDAKDKIEDGKESELTDEQRLICDCTFSNVGYNMYWGKKYSLNKRYYEALLHWENAFYSLQKRYRQLNEQQKEEFYEVCYWTGFCYTELKRYKQAYYYLDFLFTLNRVHYAEEYINCLSNGKDFRALLVIDSLLENFEEQAESKETEPWMLNFIHFLLRRKGYVLIDLDELDEAEKLFTAMLKDPKDKDFALKELAYIQRLRKGETD